MDDSAYLSSNGSDTIQLQEQRSPIVYLCASLLDIGGYLAAILVSKCMDRERFQQLSERVFLINNWPKQLCHHLWTFISLCLLSAAGLYIQDMIWILQRTECSNWYRSLNEQKQLVLKVCSIISIIFNNVKPFFTQISRSFSWEAYLHKLSSKC